MKLGLIVRVADELAVSVPVRVVVDEAEPVRLPCGLGVTLGVTEDETVLLLCGTTLLVAVGVDELTRVKVGGAGLACGEALGLGLADASGEGLGLLKGAMTRVG